MKKLSLKFFHLYLIYMSALLSCYITVKGSKTCAEVYSSTSSHPSSGTYTLANAQGQPFRVYCLFKSGYGYAFISNTINVDPNLAQLFTQKTEILIRHKRTNGQQYDATVAQITRYSSKNLGILYNSYSGYNVIRNSHMTPYLYVGFVPKAGVSHYHDTQGWRVQGRDFTFRNCDGNPNSYFTLLYNSQRKAYGSYSHGKTDLLHVWYDYATATSTADYIPDEFFASQFEIHFGGCGGYQTSTSFSGVAGASIGLKFILSCGTPATITSGSRSLTGTNPGDTVTYSCNAGYTITSGSASRTCSGGVWSGSQPTCGDINECASNPCKNGAQCVNGQNSFTCNCASGWTGTTCTADVNECASNPCKNGAACVNGANRYTCTCTAGWSGTNCDTDVNECASNPCKNGAQCTNGRNQFTCTCASGWTGTTCTTVNGGWSNWGSYSSCPVTCGTGSVTRSRSCNNPTPAHGGTTCSGSATETGTCTKPACPINGGWSNWGSYSSCPVTCGTGSVTRSRSCNNPTPAHGGTTCSGSATETGTCTKPACPINGGWSNWGSYSSCPVTCGTGSVTRSRSCNNPTPAHGGTTCSGSATETGTCTKPACPILSCRTPEKITYGSTSLTGTNPGDTVTYSCNSGYTITSGSASRTCSGGIWSGSQPTCGDIDECADGDHNCSSDAKCDNTPGSFTCTCNWGYNGNGVSCISQLRFQCNPDNSINLFHLPEDSYLFAMQVVENGNYIPCTVHDENATTVTLTRCSKDEEIIITYGSYSGVVTYKVHGGRNLVIIKFICLEISDEGVIHSINSSFSTQLAIDDDIKIDPIYSVKSLLSAASTTVGKEIIWTILFPEHYSLEVSSCTAYPGNDDSSADYVSLISNGGCVVINDLISHFDIYSNGTASARLNTFKFYGYESVFLKCSLKICPSETTPTACMTTCSREKRSVQMRASRRPRSVLPVTISNLLYVTEAYTSGTLKCIRDFSTTSMFCVIIVLTRTTRGWL
ncbi:uncharacterized protein LOC132759768 [Ruditapes philippinarum]|uniref:uncharacterized protein LOC132759768 n=1 Tax=Ruditapes philippinarum TaxID=129788 RepID=UPI00295AA19D|nr:uncharacterized protein LOC132759768 [Ruditapes philippinarum]XP_060607593.1 uncharacterized protein LOC132759768 [Ruditapes philippinarum]